MKHKPYKSYTLSTYKKMSQIGRLSSRQQKDIDVVGQVLPFKTNSYVIDELIDWENLERDPMFILTFPQKDMLQKAHFSEMSAVLSNGHTREQLKDTAHRIRVQLNPHPAGQMDHNVPEIDGTKLTGMQHKYRETVLFFPGNGQTCHAYCTFCFRWPQFVGMDEWKFAMRETELLVQYVREHTEITDVLFTGGDPLIMKTKNLAEYIDALLDANIPHLQTIRLGTKALGYWPYRFLTDADSDDLMRLFDRVIAKGKNLSLMAHFNHPVELSTDAVKQAIKRIRATGAQIRTQSPVMRNINDHPDLWAAMWREQVNQNLIPYYMFVARDTGAQDYFAVPLERAWEIYRNAYQQVSGVCRTVRGPSMSCSPGKVQVLGVNEVRYGGQVHKIMALRFIQGRNPDWVGRPFFAKYDPRAMWLDDLKPAFNEEKFFFEDELQAMYQQAGQETVASFE